MTVEEIYEEVWISAKEKFNETSSYFKEVNLWWREKKNSKSKKPFEIKVVNEKGSACAVCNWSEQCYGCPLTDTSLKYWRYLAVDWEIDVMGGEDI